MMVRVRVRGRVSVEGGVRVRIRGWVRKIDDGGVALMMVRVRARV
jgi:hypothetical protein